MESGRPSQTSTNAWVAQGQEHYLGAIHITSGLQWLLWNNGMIFYLINDYHININPNIILKNHMNNWKISNKSENAFDKSTFNSSINLLIFLSSSSNIIRFSILCLPSVKLVRWSVVINNTVIHLSYYHIIKKISYLYTNSQ